MTDELRVWRRQVGAKLDKRLDVATGAASGGTLPDASCEMDDSVSIHTTLPSSTADGNSTLHERRRARGSVALHGVLGLGSGLLSKGWARPSVARQPHTIQPIDRPGGNAGSAGASQHERRQRAKSGEGVAACNPRATARCCTPRAAALPCNAGDISGLSQPTVTAPAANDSRTLHGWEHGDRGNDGGEAVAFKLEASVEQGDARDVITQEITAHDRGAEAVGTDCAAAEGDTTASHVPLIPVRSLDGRSAALFSRRQPTASSTPLSSARCGRYMLSGRASGRVFGGGSTAQVPTRDDAIDSLRTHVEGTSIHSYGPEAISEADAARRQRRKARMAAGGAIAYSGAASGVFDRQGEEDFVPFHEERRRLSHDYVDESVNKEMTDCMPDDSYVDRLEDDWRHGTYSSGVVAGSIDSRSDDDEELDATSFDREDWPPMCLDAYHRIASDAVEHVTSPDDWQLAMPSVQIDKHAGMPRHRDRYHNDGAMGIFEEQSEEQLADSVDYSEPDIAEGYMLHQDSWDSELINPSGRWDSATLPTAEANRLQISVTRAVFAPSGQATASVSQSSAVRDEVKLSQPTLLSAAEERRRQRRQRFQAVHD